MARPQSAMKLKRPDAAALANWVFGLVMIIVPIITLATSEIGKVIPRISDSRIPTCQYVVGAMALSGVVMQGVFAAAAGRASAKVAAEKRIFDRARREAILMMCIFAIIAATYFSMASDFQVVHEFPLAASLGPPRPVYSVRYIEWTVVLPFMTFSAQGGGRTSDGKEPDGGLRASAFCLSTSCITAWVGSVTKNFAFAWTLIVFAWVAHFLSAWQILAYAWRIRHSGTGMVKAGMFVLWMLINTLYGIIYMLALYGFMTPAAEQIFWCFGDLTAKFLWSLVLKARHQADQAVADILRDAAWAEEVKLERVMAADLAKQEQALTKKIMEAVEAVEEFTHPMILMPATAFVEQVNVNHIPELQETFKATGVLRVFETREEVKRITATDALIIFFSYECLQYERVAPNEVQLRAMKAAISEVAASRQMKLDDIFVWLDCFSIPQRNAFLKKAAINAIYTFASVPDMLIIVCPETVHASTGKAANVESVKTRFWCRVEQLAYFCTQGADHMFLHQGTRLEPVPADWMDAVCCVYDADTTCCRLNHRTIPMCDRQSAVLPLLAMYYDVYKRTTHRKQLSPKDRAVWEMIQRHKEGMFPKQILYKSEEKEELRDLFGDIICRLETLLEKQYRDLRQCTGLSVVDTSSTEHVGLQTIVLSAKL